MPRTHRHRPPDRARIGDRLILYHATSRPPARRSALSPALRWETPSSHVSRSSPAPPLTPGPSPPPAKLKSHWAAGNYSNPPPREPPPAHGRLQPPPSG